VVRPTGWAQEPASGTGEDNKTPMQGFTVVATGKNPWEIADSRITLTVKNADISKATALDAGGYPAGDVAVQRSGGVATLKLPGNAMYVILQ
jgi:hypothetical protein